MGITDIKGQLGLKFKDFHTLVISLSSFKVLYKFMIPP